jgi:hypothetical protein
VLDTKRQVPAGLLASSRPPLDQEECPEPDRCGTALAGRPITAVVRRHVFDPPAVKVTVAELSRSGGIAPARHHTNPRLSTAADAAIIIYLYAGQFLSQRPRAQAVAELFGVPLWAGTMAAGSRDPVAHLCSGRRIGAGARAWRARAMVRRSPATSRSLWRR